MSYVLGIDGGGTKTLCYLADTGGRILGRGESGPSNFQAVGRQEAAKSLNAAVHQALGEYGISVSQVSTVCLGMAGVNKPGDKEIARILLEQTGYGGRMIIENDAVIALAGATAKEWGVVVISGTGSIAFGINKKGERRRAGGWGYLLGDEGSGYDIGRKGLIAAFRSFDGRSEKTLLEKLYMEHFNVNRMEEIMTKVYEEGMERHQIAALAKIVFRGAELDDRVSREIFEDAGEELVSAARTVVKALKMEGESFDLAAVGGVFEKNDYLFNVFKESAEGTFPNACVIRPRYKPVVGAVFLALREMGVNVVIGKQPNN